tara:strand:+ start:2404 stop:3897 length:1494 start_codon:yes stop_codon:yes gene_type:complete
VNILIRPLTIEDAAVSYKWRNDPEIWRFTGARPSMEITAQVEREWLANTLKDKTKSRFAILVDGVYVGNIQLTDIIVNKTAEFHIFIGEKTMWGKGVAREATYQILTYAKEVLKLRTVFLEVRKEHKAAIKSYEKNGFVTQEIIADSIKMVCTMDHLKPPMVSVFCMVYNQEKYVAQTIEGFLMQKTNFSTVMVIGEDASTDGSKEVILKYARTYPGKFKLLLSDKNFGAHKNQEKVLKHCTGKYIAMCEGDDYWTDPLKLQKQVSFMKANPKYSLIFTNGRVLYSEENNLSQLIYSNGEDKINAYYSFPLPKETTDITTLAKGNYIHTAGVLFLNWTDEGLPTYMEKVTIGDWPLHLMTATKGLIKFLDEDTFCYRIHSNGIYSKKNKIEKLRLALGQFSPVLSSGLFKKDVTNIIEDYFVKVAISYISICDSQKDYEFLLDTVLAINKPELTKKITLQLIAKNVKLSNQVKNLKQYKTFNFKRVGKLFIKKYFKK